MSSLAVRRARKLRFIELWRANVKQAAICAELGITEPHARWLRKNLGLMPRGGGMYSLPPVLIPTISSPEKTMRALGMWRQGMDTMQIARAIRTSESAVYNSLANARSRRHVDARTGADADHVARRGQII